MRAWQFINPQSRWYVDTDPPEWADSAERALVAAAEELELRSTPVLVWFAPAPLPHEPEDREVSGWYDPPTNRVLVRADIGEVEGVKTVRHECAHAAGAGEVLARAYEHMHLTQRDDR